jgi:3-hydroxyisobutyrate dehydrogenase
MSETMAKPKVAILGLGIMGSGMANRLLSANFPLAVYNRNREKCIPFASAGAYVAASPREAASRSEIILSMVGDDIASRDIWLDEDGALAGASANAVLIESSTLSGDWIQELASKAADRGCRFLDAPVTGTKPHAASGELVFLVGGSAEALDAARPVFSVLGRDVIHLGPVGSGALMKLINNFVCGVQAASFAEAVSMIDAGGLDRAKAVSVLTGGAPGSGIVKRVAERIATNDFTPNFALRWMAKDISYAIADASKNGIPLQTAAAALSVFRQAIAEGHGDQDFSAVSKLSKKRSNSRLAFES